MKLFFFPFAISKVIVIESWQRRLRDQVWDWLLLMDIADVVSVLLHFYEFRLNKIKLLINSDLFFALKTIILMHFFLTKSYVWWISTFFALKTRILMNFVCKKSNFLINFDLFCLKNENFGEFRLKNSIFWPISTFFMNIYFTKSIVLWILSFFALKTRILMNFDLTKSNFWWISTFLPWKP